MNKELMGALDELEREKNISKETLLDAIEQSLIQAYKNHFGKADNVHVTINRETGDFSVYADRRVVEFVEEMCIRDSIMREVFPRLNWKRDFSPDLARPDRPEPA